MTAAADAGPAQPPASGAGPFRRVLVAWDGSPDSIAALRTAAAIVGRSPGHVIALSIQPAAPNREAAKDEPDQSSDRARRLRTTFDTTRDTLTRNSTVRIDLHTAQSRHTADSICDYAAEHGFDLLVVGRHGDGGLTHPKLGHIAESAARSCRIPVLVVSAQ